MVLAVFLFPSKADEAVYINKDNNNNDTNNNNNHDVIRDNRLINVWSPEELVFSSSSSLFMNFQRLLLTFISVLTHFL